MKIEIIKPTEMLVSDYEDIPFEKDMVYGFIDGRPITRFTDDNYITFKYFKPLPIKKIVPLDSTDEIPNWVFGLWVEGDDGFSKRLLQVDENTLYFGEESRGAYDKEMLVNLKEACDEKMVCIAGDYMSEEFKFYKEIEE